MSSVTIDTNVVAEKYAKLALFTSSRLALYKKIAVFLDEQVPIDQILMNLSSEYKKHSKTDPRAIVLASWYRDIENGKRLSEAMSKWVPPAEAMLIKAGEESGDLANGFKNALVSTEAASNMKGAIMGAMAYPMILFTMLFGIIYMFSTQAVPKLVEIKDPAEWPEAAKGLYSLSQFVENQWWAALIAIFVVAYACAWSLGNLTGPIRSGLDRLPPWSMYKSFQSSVFLISSAAMVKTQIPLFESFQELRNMSPRYVQKHLEKIMDKMKSGSSNGDAMNSGFLDKETGIDIAIFAKTDNIQEAMDAIGRTSIKNSIERIKSIASLLNILAMGMVAGFIGYVYYCFFTLSQSVSAGAGM